MTRVNVIVEGQTEETFVNKVLYSHFQLRGIFLTPIILKTSKTGKGGVSTYGKIRNDVRTKCLQDNKSFVTTMIDYYGLPSDFPGKDTLPQGDIFKRAQYLEEQFSKNIDQTKFIPNLIIHEFEGLLYSDLEAFSDVIDGSITAIDNLKNETKSFLSPEHVNESQETAPSKRIKKHFPKYEKIIDGSLISLKIGLDVIRSKCVHFNEWMKKLEALGK